MDFMLKQLLIVLVLLAVTPYIVGIVLALLAKLRLLPLAVCGLVLSCLPNWAAAHRPLAIGLLAACVLYPHCLLDAQIHPLETGGTVLRPFPAGNGQTAVCPGGV